MKPIACNFFLGVALLAAPLHAQNPLSQAVKASYQPIQSNLLKAAEKMPESDYAFRPTPDVRTFGQLIAHIADAQTGICSVVKGTPRRGDAASKASKADLIAALKASNELCDGVYSAMSDQEGLDIVKTPFGQKPKLSVLGLNVDHDNETYGTIAVYLRLKGIVPPSSEAK
jgi:uncharacterized damage-inducible protein DinB